MRLGVVGRKPLWIFAATFLIACCFSLCACNAADSGGSVPCTEYTDENGDGICDVCGEPTDADSDRLAQPRIVNDGNLITWEKVKNADYYDVYINDEYIRAVVGTKYEFNILRNGTYSVNICARSVGESYAPSARSNSISYTVAQKELAEPRVSIEHAQVVWNAVEGADGYVVIVNGEAVKNAWIAFDNGVCRWEIPTNLPPQATVSVISRSTDGTYESESGKSNELDLEIAQSSAWSPSKMQKEWKGDGVSYGGGSAKFTDGASMRILAAIKSGETFLHVEKSGAGEPNLAVNGATITAKSSADGYFVYDLTAYAGKVVSLKILSEGEIEVSSLWMAKADGTADKVVWENAAIYDGWLTYGDVKIHDEGVCLESEGREASIKNRVAVDGEKPYFSISVRKFVRPQGEDQDYDPKIYVYVNDTLVRAIGVDGDCVRATSDYYDKYYYDLRAYTGQAVTVTVKNTDGEHACFNKIYFGTKGEYSTATQWDIGGIQDEWEFSGEVVVHGEGVCLENYGTQSSLTNRVAIGEQCVLQISFRKFVRDVVQDKDPHIEVWVNDVLIKAIGSSADHVTATGDNYETFSFDLSAYKGSVVTIVIKNVEGEHACFNFLNFTNVE